MGETTYTDEEVGKYVVTADGDRVGTVTAVRHGTPYIDPDPDVFGRIKAAMGREDIDDDAYPLQEEAVNEITDSEIRLRQF